MLAPLLILGAALLVGCGASSEASPFRSPATFGHSDFGKPKVDEQAIRVPFDYEPSIPGGGPLLALGSQVPLTDIYDCALTVEGQSGS